MEILHMLVQSREITSRHVQSRAVPCRYKHVKIVPRKLRSRTRSVQLCASSDHERYHHVHFLSTAISLLDLPRYGFCLLNLPIYSGT